MIPAGVIQVRADICHDCPTPCAERPPLDVATSLCPLRRWGQYGVCDGSQPPAPSGLKGLGDLVALVAEPIAQALKIDPAKCGCKARRAWLNDKVPFTRPAP